jgi:SAM-dependent methyltransferase
MTSCRICGGTLGPSRFVDLKLMACASCGAEFAEGADTAAYASDQYLADHADLQWDHAQRQLEARMRVTWISKRVTAGSLYEVGAAAGWFLDAARRSGFRVRGVEPSPALSAHAREKLGLDVVTGYAEDQPPGAHADVACLWHVVEHASDPVGLLRACAAQVAPGGLIFLEVPNVASPVAQHLGARWPALADRSHVTHFTAAALRTAFEAAGLEPIEVATIPRWRYRSHAALLRPRPAASMARDIWLSRGLVRAEEGSGDLLRAVAER